MNKFKTGILFVGLFLAPAAALLAGDEVLAVISSDSDHYKEALKGFQDSYGTAPVVNVQAQKPVINDKTRVVVAFGGKAALQDYKGVPVLICMAPSVNVKEISSSTKKVYVPMTPRARVLLRQLKELQPSLKRLAVFWASESLRDYIGEMKESATAIGIELVPVYITDPAALPQRLRELQGKADALLLPPDPSLVSSHNFTTIKDFSWANHVPFYAPTEGLVAKGATASISTNFRQIGEYVAKVARQMADGVPVSDVMYVEDVFITLSASAAEHTNLSVPPAMDSRIQSLP